MADEPAIEGLKAIAHPLRLRILQVLARNELNVGEIDEAAGIGQPALSQQLGVLRKAGLVETRKEAKLVYYRLSGERLGEIATILSELAGTQAIPPVPTRTPAPGAANFARLS